MLMPIYTAGWEWKLATRDQRLVEAEQARVARVHWSAREDRQQDERPRPQRSPLKRLLTSLRYAGA
jgi:hypothetical protein